MVAVNRRIQAVRGQRDRDRRSIIVTAKATLSRLGSAWLCKSLRGASTTPHSQTRPGTRLPLDLASHHRQSAHPLPTNSILLLHINTTSNSVPNSIPFFSDGDTKVAARRRATRIARDGLTNGSITPAPIHPGISRDPVRRTARRVR